MRIRPKSRRSGGTRGSAPINAYFVCNEGTVSHYAHFFFGCLVPLIDADTGRKYRICTYVGSMRGILKNAFPRRIVSHEEADPGSDISDKQRLFNLFVSMKRAPPPPEESILFDAYDIFKCLNYMYVSKAPDPVALAALEVRYLAHYSGNTGVVWTVADRKRYKHLSVTDKVIRLMEAKPRVCAFFAAHREKPIPFADILLIERRFSGTKIAKSIEDNHSGNRRIIYNHEALREAMESAYGERIRNVCLDDMDIFEQYQLFSRARVVVAQHGAGLSNIFFMDTSKKSRGATLVEICPDWNNDSYWFENLAEFCGIDYISVAQPRMTAAEWRSFAPGAAADGPGTRAATGAYPEKRLAPVLKNERAIKAKTDARLMVHQEATFVMNSGSVDVEAVMAAVESVYR